MGSPVRHSILIYYKLSKNGVYAHGTQLSLHIECSEDQFKCKSSGCSHYDHGKCHPSNPCIPKEWRCDGDRYGTDCEDGSDEVDCGEYSS